MSEWRGARFVREMQNAFGVQMAHETGVMALNEAVEAARAAHEAMRAAEARASEAEREAREQQLTHRGRAVDCGFLFRPRS